MTAPSRPLGGKPHAETIPVEDLVDKFLRGQIRVPSFQRRLKWGPTDVLRLLDSVYRGFPIGSLLMWKRAAGAQRVRLGPFDFPVEARNDAWFVVDGQQRITSLAATLRHPRRTTHDSDGDPFRLSFDLASDRFRIAERDDDELQRALVPVDRLFDAVDLADWLREHPEVGREDSRRAHAVGKALREYRIPVYVIETEDEDVLREVFERVNNFGVALTQAEVFDALIGSRSGAPGSGDRLTDLVDDLAQLGMGTIKENLALQLVLSVAGLDVTRSFKDLEHRERDMLRGVTPKATSAARIALEFLRTEAHVLHLRLLPYSWPLVVLTRFFHVHPLASARSRELLSRWLWRGMVRGPGSIDDRTLLRRAIRAISSDVQGEEDTVQALLPLAPQEWNEIRYELPPRFDARPASSRIAMAALAALNPRELESGGVVDVAALLNRRDEEAYARVVSGGDGQGSVGNRVLHDRCQGGIFAKIQTRAERETRDGVLLSHAIDIDAAEAAARGDRDGFVLARESYLRGVVERFLVRMTRFEYGDRASVAHILEGVAAASE